MRGKPSIVGEESSDVTKETIVANDERDDQRVTLCFLGVLKRSRSDAVRS